MKNHVELIERISHEQVNEYCGFYIYILPNIILLLGASIHKPSFNFREYETHSHHTHL